MKSNDIKALRKKSLQELRTMAHELHAELRKLRLEKTEKKGKNVHLTSIKQDDVARVLTALRMKELTP